MFEWFTNSYINHLIYIPVKSQKGYIFYENKYKYTSNVAINIGILEVVINDAIDEV